MTTAEKRPLVREALPDPHTLWEALAFVERHARRMQKSLRKPYPVPVEGIDAGLELIRLAAREARGLPHELGMSG